MQLITLYIYRVIILLSILDINSPARLTKTLVGIPRPRKEDLVIDDGSDQDEYAKFRKPKELDLLGEWDE